MKRILLVEDDEKLAKLINEYLEKQGVTVDWERRGDKAVYRTWHEKYALILLDINLPRIKWPTSLQNC